MRVYRVRLSGGRRHEHWYWVGPEGRVEAHLCVFHCRRDSLEKCATGMYSIGKQWAMYSRQGRAERVPEGKVPGYVKRAMELW